MSDIVCSIAQDVPLDLSCRGPEKEINFENSSKFQKCLPCQMCGKNFDRPSLLKRHLRTHTGEKPHGCSVCGKMFSTSSSLNTHVRIHTGERPHECHICGKRFTASSNLYYHRMTHYKEKPHKCNECGRSFPTPGDLRAHGYSHSGNWPMRCSVCNRGFCKPGALQHHMRLHTGNRSYHCIICKQQFSNTSIDNFSEIENKSHFRKPFRNLFMEFLDTSRLFEFGCGGAEKYEKADNARWRHLSGYRHTVTDPIFNNSLK